MTDAKGNVIVQYLQSGVDVIGSKRRLFLRRYAAIRAGGFANSWLSFPVGRGEESQRAWVLVGGLPILTHEGGETPPMSLATSTVELELPYLSFGGNPSASQQHWYMRIFKSWFSCTTVLCCLR